MLRVTCAVLLGALTIASVAVAGDARSPVNRGGGRLQELLNTGFQRGKARLAEAERLYASSHKQLGDDPRLDYAYGLILLKHLQRRRAIEHFQKLTAASPHYSPAFRALIWGTLTRKKFKDGFTHLDRFLQVLTKPSAGKLDAAARRAEITWIGRVLTALEITSLSKRNRQLLVLQEQKTRALLTDANLAAYNRGCEEVRKEHQELLRKQKSTKKQVAEKQKRDITRGKKRIASQRDKARDNSETLKLTASEWKQWFDKQGERLKASLAALEKEYAFLGRRSKSLSKSIQLVQRELNSISLQLRTRSRGNRSRRNRNAPTVIPPAAQQAIRQRQRQISSYRSEYRTTQSRINRVRQTATFLLAEHSKSARRYERATGKLARKNRELEKWRSRLDRKEQNLKRGSIGTSRRTHLLDKRLRSFSTYVKIDPDREKARLLKELKKDN